MLLASAGLRTPPLALMALRRPRLLALVVAPYVAAFAFVDAIGPGLEGLDRTGLQALAVAPALLAAPLVAPSIGGRADRSGALVVGSLVGWFLLNAASGLSGFPDVGPGAVAFVAGATVAAAVPTLPDVLRTIGQRVGDAAFLVLGVLALAGAAATEGHAPIVLGAALLAATALAALVVAGLTGVEASSALVGAGSRDAAVAAAMAIAAGGLGAAAVAFWYGLFGFALLEILRAARRGGLRRRPGGPSIPP